MTTSFISITVTTGSLEEAQKIAHALVEEHLAACVTIQSGIESVYRWHGQIEEAQEWLLNVKTMMSHFENVRRKIESLHSYACPVILATPVVAGNPIGLSWMIDPNA